MKSPLIAAALALVVGFTAGGYWFRRPTPAPTQTAPTSAEPAVVLAPSTRAVLDRLAAPVDLHLFTLLSPADAASDLQAFARRLENLAAAFARHSRGHLRVHQQNTRSQTVLQAAVQAGLKPLQATSAEPTYLGLVVTQDRRSEALPRLTPDWEAALEFDLARAIVRLTTPAPTLTSSPDPTLARAAHDTITRLLPNPQSVSVEDGKALLRQASLQQFQTVVQELQQELKAAQDRLARAGQAGSDADRQAAVEDLKRLQASQAEKLAALARQAAAEIEAWTELKRPNP